MTATFLKITIRNLWKYKGFSSINLLGLTLGFSVFMLVVLFVRYELGWDKSNVHYPQLYRVQYHYAKLLYSMDGNDISPHSQAGTAQLLERHFPEFEKVSVIRSNENKYFSVAAGNPVFDEKGIYADSCFFDLFTYHFIEGNADKALDEPFTVVLSKTMANKLFGGASALNKTILFEKKYQLKVKGVYNDLPFNSSVRPSYIISFATLAPVDGISRSDIRAGGCMTFALLKPNVDAHQLENKIKHILSDFKGLEYEELQLCPMSKVYLNFNNRGDYSVVIDLFILIGIFILLMSGFNYVNLTVSKVSVRTKEVAVEKVLGSNRPMLVIQFLSETIILSFLALMMAFLLTTYFLPVFSNIVGKKIGVDLMSDWHFIALMGLVALVFGILSGIYPALFMSSKKIVSLFKGDIYSKGRETFSLKKILVILQFTISLFLIVLTISISLQIEYITHKDLGFDKEGLLYTRMTVPQNGFAFDPLRNRILQNPEIKNASLSKNLPFVSFGGGKTNWEGGNPDEKISCRFNEVSYDFISNIGAKIIVGRDFSRDFPGDAGQACIINETAAKCFGWDHPIGKHLNNNRLRVVGVVRNFIYKDMHNGIEPSIMILAPQEVKGNWTFAFRVEAGNMLHAKTLLTNEFEKLFPNNFFEFRDVSSAFNNENSFTIYHSVNRTILFFTLLNIFLAIIGLLGLVSFSAARCTKEIGVRKINGCSSFGIFILLSREYYVWLVIALILAVPFAWWVITMIPGANKLPPQPWVFVLGTSILFVIILATTSYQAIKAAFRNPIEALRYE
jgi:putative ABC transport system permease protein